MVDNQDGVLYGELEKHIELAEAGGKNIVTHEYAWEVEYNKSWQHVQTTEEGILVAGDTSANRLRYISKPDTTDEGLLENGEVSRRCILRNIVVIIDCSKNCLLNDYKPYRLNVFANQLEIAFNTLLGLTPLAYVSIIVSYNMKGHIVQRFTSDQEELKTALKSLLDNELPISEGHMSLYISVNMALDLLENSVHGSKEIYMCIMSNATIDERPLDELIPRSKEMNTIVTAISLTPEIYAVRNFCECTGGRSIVVLDTKHLAASLALLKKLPKWTKQINPYLVQCALVEMHHLTNISMCMCHEYAILKSVTCPRCGAIHCQTAIKCVLCGLLLLQDFDIHRLTLTYNILPKFQSIMFQNKQKCHMCITTMGDTDAGRKCSACTQMYCETCFSIMENKLQFCPSCAKQTILENRMKDN